MLGGSVSWAGLSAGKDDGGEAREDAEMDAGVEAREDSGAAARPDKKAGMMTTTVRIARTRAKTAHPITTRLLFIFPPSVSFEDHGVEAPGFAVLIREVNKGGLCLGKLPPRRLVLQQTQFGRA
jgi:hypothetical protein